MVYLNFGSDESLLISQNKTYEDVNLECVWNVFSQFSDILQAIL